MNRFLLIHYGNIASVIGLLVSIWALRRGKHARRIADEARKTAMEAVDRAKAQAFQNEFVRTVHLVRGFRDNCRSRTWERALYYCEDCVTILARLQSSEYLLEDEKAHVSAHIDDLRLLQDQVESHRRESPKKTIPYGVLSSIAQIHDGLNATENRIQNSVWKI